MKRLFLLFVTLFLLSLNTSTLGWNLFFIDQLEDIGDGEMGFVLGEYKLTQSQVVTVKTVGANHMFIYVTENSGLVVVAYTLPEFRGFGYADMIWRIAVGLSNAGTLAEMKYVGGAHWYTGGEWHFGSIHEWETAGSLEPVWFGRYRGIFGVDIE